MEYGDEPLGTRDARVGMVLRLSAPFGVPGAKTPALTCGFAKPPSLPQKAKSLTKHGVMTSLLAQNSALDSQIVRPAHQERRVLGIGIVGHPETLLFATPKERE